MQNLEINENNVAFATIAGANYGLCLDSLRLSEYDDNANCTSCPQDEDVISEIRKAAALQSIMVHHNRLTKPMYQVDSVDALENWVFANGNLEDGIIEIPSNETISGHAEILDIDSLIECHYFG